MITSEQLIPHMPRLLAEPPSGPRQLRSIWIPGLNGTLIEQNPDKPSSYAAYARKHPDELCAWFVPREPKNARWTWIAWRKP